MLLFLWLACTHQPNIAKAKPLSECVVNPQQTGQLSQYLLTPQFQNPINENRTGVYVLEDGAGALAARAWLTEQASATLDAQYFIYSADNVGLLSTAALIAAANRGIQIRILVDDVLAHGDADLLTAINQHPKIEVRIYNPNINVGKKNIQKIQNVVFDFDSINQRMHNKTFIVDGQVAITGGRNVGDEYYDFDSDYNFRDRDVTLIGSGAQQVQASFEEFWNDSHAVNIQELMEPISEQQAQLVWRQLEYYACDARNYHPLFRQRVEKVLETLQQQSSQLYWVDNVSYISDHPGKNNTSSLTGGGITTTELIKLTEQAQQRIWIQTPYLVLSEVGLQVFQALRSRNIEVKILTNSLAATDNYPAFAGYRKVRQQLLDMGVEVYELNPYGPDVMALNTTGLADKTDAMVGLHAKSMIIDNNIAVIGSFNLDPRSANLNTECLVIMNHEEITAQMAAYFEREMNIDNAWPAHRNNDKEASILRRFVTRLSQIVPSSVL